MSQTATLKGWQTTPAAICGHWLTSASGIMTILIKPLQCWRKCVPNSRTMSALKKDPMPSGYKVSAHPILYCVLSVRLKTDFSGNVNVQCGNKLKKPLIMLELKHHFLSRLLFKTIVVNDIKLRLSCSRSFFTITAGLICHSPYHKLPRHCIRLRLSLNRRYLPLTCP